MKPSSYSVTVWQGRTTMLASLADHLSDVAQGAWKISKVPLPAVVLRHSRLRGQPPAEQGAREAAGGGRLGTSAN
jgi:hypothetical protein